MDEEGSAILEIISSAKSEPFHSLPNQESYFYPSPPLFLSPFAVGAYGVLSLRITPPIRTRLGWPQHSVAHCCAATSARANPES